MTATPKTVYLKDYLPPAYLAESIMLDVDFRRENEEVVAFVASEIVFQANPAHKGKAGRMLIHGEALETLYFSVEGNETDFAEVEKGRELRGLPSRFTLKTRVKIYPDRNTRLTGLYRSRNGYFTQCEAEGFRRITWFPDRPDVMTCFQVTIHADKEDFPVLLSNGNQIEAGEEDRNRHYAIWHDPFRKPCYLFALVAARLDVLRDSFTTADGRAVDLAIYAEPGRIDQCGHAMLALKKAMRWDEERFGLECDLDRYMIVAVSDFNMGAMENKGLNIFNAKYVLAKPEVATDLDFEGIDRVVAHEYFHNWTGNRVTCRDWFQLSLKEGLTVFRDQEFGADTHNAQTARIREVRGLFAMQFPEDAGPMAHPVRPDSYMEINNFYTATVYEKGAEVVRMIQTLIGKDAFRAGLTEYFRRHDGEAVTCEDFVAAMADTSGVALMGSFLNWYSTPGTPRLSVEAAFDPEARRYTLLVAQDNPKALEIQGSVSPSLIPFKVALFDDAGVEIPGSARTLIVDREKQAFVFDAMDKKPVPSLLRDFSAPVTLDYAYKPDELGLLVACESDPFAAWSAGQRLASDLILAAAREKRACRKDESAGFADMLKSLLGRWEERGAAFVAEVLTLPGEITLAEMLAREGEIDPDALRLARDSLRYALAEHLEAELLALYHNLAPAGSYRFTAAEAGRRALRHACLANLLELDKPIYRQLALRQYRQADNMTDRFAALAALAYVQGEICPEREEALAAFYEDWRHETLALDKWLAAQASGRRPDTLPLVRALTRHPAFDRKNPNKIYALIRTFGANLPHFHAADGAGYRFMAAEILALDEQNPQVAARISRAFDHWKRFDAIRQKHARAALEDALATPRLSTDVYEILARTLGRI
ncbi:MAG: aminopeptidase N [Zoogloeaceae bacterium]|jgi:aminopeptidase N|nr:aminopeptidase N [Zoogloeaceae bacterium]